MEKELELIEIPALEREVIGQIAGGDAGGLAENLANITTVLAGLEAMLNIDVYKIGRHREKLETAAKGLRRIIARIGKIETVKCAYCGDGVLKQSCISEDGESYLCTSCVAALAESKERK